MTKKFVSMFLALVMCLSLTATSVGAVEDMAETSHPEIDFDGPMVFYPFVYTEEPGWAWARELIGDCSNLVPGYLYLQDFRTKEITQIIEEPVDMFCSDNEILYCLVGGTSVVRTNYWGEEQTLLYTSQYGNLANLEYWDDVLLFSDGDHVIRFDVVASNGTDMGIYEGISAIYMDEDTSFTWADAKGVEYLRSADGRDEMVPEIACEIEEFFGIAEMPFECSKADVAVPYAVTVPITFPLPEYPAGSYFTKDEGACTDHHTEGCPSSTCNCRYYRGGSQCEGFGRYVLDRYAHIPLSANSAWYQLTDTQSKKKDPHVLSNTEDTFNSSADVRAFFLKYAPYNYDIGYGTYLRLSGQHTVIVADISSDSVTLYDANWSTTDFCVVKFTEYTYAQFYNTTKFRSITRIVAHSFDNITNYGSKTYHRAACSLGTCPGYIIEEHYAISVGKNATCLGCGYVGEIWNQAPITE